MVGLFNITDDPIDLYYYLGDDRIGCMDYYDRNFNPTAVVDDGSCFGRNISSNIDLLSIEIYPQPTNSVLYISINSTALDYNLSDIVEIKNIIGETVLIGSVNKDINPTKLEVNNLPTGVYYLVLKINNESITKKLIIE